VSTENIKGLGFGSKYKGLQAVWSFKFSPDRIGVYGKELEFLINDLDQIPIIKNLRETINIQKAIFELTDAEYKNTIIKAY
jgi:hypothetical protein